MKFWKWFSRFFASLFEKARPGLDKFIEDALPEAKRIVSNLADEYVDLGFHTYKNDARVFLINALAAIGIKGVPDTWIDIVLNFAYEHVKSEIAKRKN